MGHIALCRLSKERLALLRADPTLAAALRTEIRKKGVPRAVWVGRLTRRDRDRTGPDLVGGYWSELTRRERLRDRFDAFGPRAWERVRPILDGEVGERVRSFARIVPPLVVARAAASMRKEPKAARNAVERVADAVRALIRESAAAGEWLLALGPEPKARGGPSS